MHIVWFLLPLISLCSGGRTCSSCQDAEGVGACSQHTTCSDDEVCYMQQFTTGTGQKLYDFGCSVKMVCPTEPGIFVGKRSEDHHTLCYECCNETDLCNQYLTCHTNTVNPESKLPLECSDITPTIKSSGVYIIYPFGIVDRPVHVHCIVDDMNRIWTVIQQRSNGSVNFYRNWISYKKGFGDPRGAYWLGNDAIHLISSSSHHELMINVSDFENARKYAEYKTVHIGDEHNGYRLFVNGYSGDAVGMNKKVHHLRYSNEPNAGIVRPRSINPKCISNFGPEGQIESDGLKYNSGYRFTTFDKDNDGASYNCATRFKGAWWFNYCHYIHLNGEYLSGRHNNSWSGVMWYSFRGDTYSLRSTLMMIRKLN